MGVQSQGRRPDRPARASTASPSLPPPPFHPLWGYSSAYALTAPLRYLTTPPSPPSSQTSEGAGDPDSNRSTWSCSSSLAREEPRKEGEALRRRATTLTRRFKLRQRRKFDVDSESERRTFPPSTRFTTSWLLAGSIFRRSREGTAQFGAKSETLPWSDVRGAAKRSPASLRRTQRTLKKIRCIREFVASLQSDADRAGTSDFAPLYKWVRAKGSGCEGVQREHSRVLLNAFQLRSACTNKG